MLGNLLLLSLLTGVISGIFIVLYGLLTKLFTHILFFGDPFESIAKLPIWYIYLVPIVSIFIVNYLISKDEAVKEYGVSEIAQAIESGKLKFGIKDLIIKIFASALSIASGFAIGNEGPSAAIGAMIAYKLHQLFNLPKKLIRVSLGIGASSGIAAIFVSPITGIMFAIENITYEFVKNYAGYLVAASIIAFSIAAQFLDSLTFGYSTGKSLNYHYLYATIFFIPVMTFFVYFYLALKEKVLLLLRAYILKHFLKYKLYILPIISGSIIATIMLIMPYAAFSGHEVVKMLINHNFYLPLLLIFGVIFLRIIATAVSLYAHAVGGVFIALMSIGSLIGYGFGELLSKYSSYSIEPFYFAAIGAAVFMGVLMRLPLTAIVLALEITYDYNIIIPTGLSVVIVTFLSTIFFDVKKL